MLKRPFFFFLLIFFLPATLSAQDIAASLQAAKKQNDLSEWVYLRLDHVYPDPVSRLPFLMSTQKEAWRRPKTKAERVAWLLLLSTQGYYQLQNGNILASISGYEDAHRYFAEDTDIDFDAAEYIYKPLSNNYTRLGDYERAVYIQHNLISYALEGNDLVLSANTRANLAISYRSMEAYDKALEQVAKGLADVKGIEESIILLNNVKADILFDLGRFGEAARVAGDNLKRQLRRKIDQGNAYRVVGAYVTLGNAQLQMEQAKAADIAYLKAIALLDRYFRGTRKRERAAILIQRGKLLLIRKNAKQALQQFDSGLKLLENSSRRYPDNNVVEALRGRGAAFQQLGMPEKAFSELRAALEAAASIRHQLAEEKTRYRFQATYKTMAEEAIAVGYALYKKTGDPAFGEAILLIAESSKAQTLLDAVLKNQQKVAAEARDPLLQRRDQLEKAIVATTRENMSGKTGDVNLQKLQYDLSLVEGEIKKKYPAMGRSANATAENFNTLVAHTTPRDVLEYFAGDSAIYGIHVSNRKVVDIRRIGAPVIKKALGDFVDTYFNNGPDAMLNDPGKFYKTSFGLYDQLVPASARNTKTLVIIPDGAIGYLSFDGLITSPNYEPDFSKWPFFIRRSAISYAFSLQTLAGQAQTSASKHGFTGFFITHAGKSAAYLPAVKEEADAVRKAVAGKYLLDDKAVSGSLFKSINESEVMHLSTHATLFGPQQEPQLQLADKSVFLFEIFTRGHAPKLVVLSACQTANGTLQNGEGVISFSRGFSALGVRGTVAGLWKLNDEVAAKLMADFYRNLSDGMSASTALHQAKLNSLNGRHDSDALYLPYYWSALNYSGMDQQLALSKPFNYYWLALGGVPLLFFLLRKRKKK